MTSSGTYYFPVDDALVALKEKDDDIYVNFSVGGNYTFSDNTKITMEYYRNDEGYDDTEFDEFTEFVNNEAENLQSKNDLSSTQKLLKANQLLGDRVRKNYLALSYDRPYTFDDFTPHLGTIVCLDDGSFMANAMLTYNIRDDTTLTLDMKTYVGDDDTEWGLKPDNYRVFVGVKYYF